MTVFRNYFKIVKTYWILILIYVVIFTGFAILFSVSGNDQNNTFTEIKPKVSISDFNKTTLSGTFVEYMKEHTKIVDLGDTKKEDALFYREVDATIEIPKDFSMDKGKVKVDSVPDSSMTVLLEQQIDTFFQTVSIYQKSGMDEEEVSKYILKDLKTDVTVNFLEKNQEKLGSASSFFNFLNYVFLALITSIVSMVMNSYLDKNIKKRNIVSSYSYKKSNAELLLGNACFMILLWSVFFLISIFFYKETMLMTGGLLILLNFFIFGVAALSIGFLIGSLVKNKEAQNGITNVIALGSSFIAGAFVPQEFLGGFVLGIAKLTPSYWFIANNNDIALLSHYTFSDLKIIFIRMGIVLLFALLFFVITNVISKRKRESS